MENTNENRFRGMESAMNNVRFTEMHFAIDEEHKGGDN